MKRAASLLLVTALVAAVLVAPVHAATIVVTSTDGADEGFNDPTPWTPAGGNPATTLGQARMNVFKRAAAMWGQRLVSTVTITVNASFDPLDCTADSGTLGQAGSDYFYAAVNSTPTVLYPRALRNKIKGSDVGDGYADITAQFNSKLNNDSTCLGGENFYYGYDHNLGNNDIADLLGVVLHELGHGLGFISIVGSDGVGYKSSGTEYFSIFDQFIYDESSGKYWKSMTDAERATSTLNNQHVVWNDAGRGARLNGTSYLTTGKTPAGHVKLYAPTTWDDGSSISHWDSTATPNLLMEPVYHADTPNHTDLTTCAMYDMGWGGSRCPDYANSAPVATSQAISTNANTPIAVTLAASDADGDALAYSVVASPAHGAVTGSGTGRTYTPTTGYVGADSFTYLANDGIDDSAAATVSITVNAMSSSSSSSSSGGSSSSSSSSGGSKSGGGGGSFRGVVLMLLGVLTLLVVRRRMFASN